MHPPVSVAATSEPGEATTGPGSRRRRHLDEDSALGTATTPPRVALSRSTRLADRHSALRDAATHATLWTRISSVHAGRPPPTPARPATRRQQLGPAGPRPSNATAGRPGAYRARRSFVVAALPRPKASPRPGRRPGPGLSIGIRRAARARLLSPVPENLS